MTCLDMRIRTSLWAVIFFSLLSLTVITPSVAQESEIYRTGFESDILADRTSQGSSQSDQFSGFGSTRETYSPPWSISGGDPSEMSRRRWERMRRHHWVRVVGGKSPKSCNSSQGSNAPAGYRFARSGEYSLYAGGALPTCGEIRPLRPAGLDTDATFSLRDYARQENIDINRFRKVIVEFDLKAPSMAEGDVFEVLMKGSSGVQAAELTIAKLDRSVRDQVVYENVGSEITSEVINDMLQTEDFQKIMQPNTSDGEDTGRIGNERQASRRADGTGWARVRFEVAPDEINHQLWFSYEATDSEPISKGVSRGMFGSDTIYGDEGVYIDNLKIVGSQQPLEQQREQEESSSPWGDWDY